MLQKTKKYIPPRLIDVMNILGAISSEGDKCLMVSCTVLLRRTENDEGGTARLVMVSMDLSITGSKAGERRRDGW